MATFNIHIIYTILATLLIKEIEFSQHSMFITE